ncbi:MAG: hypothetical protein QG639_364 [Patescibacteria group bacterium]|nr:hypothetical protein [Patescibacteria group bacterium]
MNEVGIAELPPEVKAEAAAEQSQSEAALPELPASEIASVEVPAPESPPALDSIPQWQQLLKRREKITKQDLGSLPAERTGQKVDVYSLSEEEQLAKVQEATGIGKKLAERVSKTITDLKNNTADLQPGQRELVFPFNSAADLMIVPYVGMARANEIAKVLGLEEAVKVEPFEPEYDEALGDDAGGFDDEPGTMPQAGNSTEIDIESPAGWDNRGEEADKQFGHLPDVTEDASVDQAQAQAMSLDDLEIKGVAMEAKGTVTREMAVENIAKKQDPRETRKKMFRAILDSVGASAATFFDKMDQAAGRALQSSGVGAMESVVNTAVNNMEKPWEYPANGAAENVQNEKSLFRSVLEKLPKLKLSEKQRTLLREKIVPVGAVLGGVAATALLTTALLTGGYGFQQSQAETVKGSLTVLVELGTANADEVGQFESGTATPAEDTSTNAEEPQNVVVPGILRDGGEGWQSAAAEEIAKEQNTAYKAPEQTAEEKQEVAQNLANSFGVQSFSQPTEESATVETDTKETPDVILTSKWLNEKVPENAQEILAQANADGQPAENVKLFMPTLGEKFQAPIPEAKAAEGVKKDGVLYNQKDSFIEANGLPDDEAAWNAFVNLYVRFNPNTNWNAIISGQTTFDEFNSLEELNSLVAAGKNVTLNPETEKVVYEALHDPSSVGDENVRETAQELRNTTINPKNMTAEQLETFLGYFLNSKAEIPAN